MSTPEFRPGLEGVVAFETEIAEPDKDGGALRYRGIDIEELVGRYPFENVWGLLVDGTSTRRCSRSTASSSRIRAGPCPWTSKPRSRRSAQSGA